MVSRLLSLFSLSLLCVSLFLYIYLYLYLYLCICLCLCLCLSRLLARSSSHCTSLCNYLSVPLSLPTFSLALSVSGFLNHTPAHVMLHLQTDVLVLEAGATVGGRVRAVELPTLPGQRFNAGAGVIRGTIGNPVAALAEAIDAPRVIYPPVGFTSSSVVGYSSDRY